VYNDRIIIVEYQQHIPSIITLRIQEWCVCSKFRVFESEEITFSESNLLIYNGMSATNIPTNSIRKITFSSINTNVSTENSSNSLTLYPNPVSNILHLKSLNAENLTVRIFSIDGKTLITQTLPTDHPDVDVTILPKGFYILKANDQTVRFTRK